MQSAAGTPQADFKYRDTCYHIEDPERVALVGFTIASLVSWIMLMWWYTTGHESSERQDS